MKEKIAISGQSGFIGSHLSGRLTNYIRLGRDGYVPGFVDFDPVVAVFDLAAWGNLASQNTGPITENVKNCYQANLIRVVEEISNLRGSSQKFIYTSTSSVTLPKQTPYSISKKATEDYLKYASTLGYKIAIVRPYTIVGIGEPKEHLIPKLIDSCLNGTEMPFVPDPCHDFLDVEDFVDALLLIEKKGEFKGEIYEIGGGEQVSNNTVRQMVEEVTEKKANLKYVDNLRSYDTKSWKANLERISTLDWKPKKNLMQTIKEMVAYAKTNTRNI